jgi:hypothetical protein
VPLQVRGATNILNFPLRDTNPTCLACRQQKFSGVFQCDADVVGSKSLWQEGRIGFHEEGDCQNQ